MDPEIEIEFGDEDPPQEEDEASGSADDPEPASSDDDSEPHPRQPGPEPARMVYRPPRPRVGGLKRTNEYEWTAFTGGMPSLDGRRRFERPTHIVATQYRSNSAGSAAKSTMTARALETVRSVAKYKLQYGTRTMAEVAAYTFPDAEQWPYVWIDGYWKIVENVIPTSLNTGMNLAPLVEPGKVNVSEFEEFVYNKFAEVFPDHPDMGARSHFGKGIWVMDPSIDTEDNRYHDTTGVSIHGSDRVFLAPKVQGSWIGVIDSEWVMMNVHGFNNQGKAVDYVMDCVEERALADNPGDINCQSVSPMQPSKPPAEHLGMFGFVATPIYPANDPTTCVGFIFGLVYFSELLEEMYPGDYEGIDCVFTTNEQTFTYTLENGSGVFRGEGDLHHKKYNKFKMETDLFEPDSMSKKSVQYHCACYPNDDFGEIYTTKAPAIAATGAVLIILFVSTLFFLYDGCVRHEFNARKELLEAKRQFVRFVSHEVRTPLNSVGMGLTLMKEEMEKSINSVPSKGNGAESVSKSATEPWFNLVDEIQSNTQCAVDVLTDLLNYDKIETGSLTLELTVVEILSLIENTFQEFKLPLASKDITLNLKLPTKTLESINEKVIGDSVRLTQVLRNLASNAIKFTPDGGLITVEAKWEDLQHESMTREFTLKGNERVVGKSTHELVLSVKDTGAGMTPEQLKKLFGRGVQFNVNDLQKGKGSGLGLYIAKGIVESHDGQLTCDSQGIGFGSTFTVRLPLYSLPQEEPDVEMAQHESVGDLDFVDCKLLILVVDDVLSNRKFLTRLLCNRGHKVDQAEDGDIAVTKVQEAEQAGKPYDLVLMDYEMPRMDGPTAAKHIRDNGSNVYIAGVTGNIMAEDVEHFHACGAGVILSKPVKITEVEDMIVEQNITGSIESENDEPEPIIFESRQQDRPKKKANIADPSKPEKQIDIEDMNSEQNSTGSIESDPFKPVKQIEIEDMISEQSSTGSIETENDEPIRFERRRQPRKKLTMRPSS